MLAGFLEKSGYKQVFDAENADFIIINTCGFINSAKKESIDAVYAAKTNYPEAKIILSGCLAQRYAQDLYESMPELDGVFGNGDISKISEFMKKVVETVKDYDSSIIMIADDMRELKRDKYSNLKETIKFDFYWNYSN